MSLSVLVPALLDYSDHERRKWRDWIATDPQRLTIAVQPGGRFPAAADLLDHVFFAERRNLCRLEGATPPDETGIPRGEWERLFEYGDLVRADLRRYVSDLTDIVADGVITFTPPGGSPVTMSRRRLIAHVFVHETRHLAQLALAARIAGIEPPGKHDLFYFDGFA